MIVKDLYPYLILEAESKNIIYNYKTPRGKEYKIYFYIAKELEPVSTFVCISSNKNIDFYIISDNKVIWRDDCVLSKSVKQFVDRLIKLLIFM